MSWGEHNIIARRRIQDLIRSGLIDVTTSGRSFVVSPGPAYSFPAPGTAPSPANSGYASGSPSGSSLLSQYLPWVLLAVGILIIIYAYVRKRK